MRKEIIKINLFRKNKNKNLHLKPENLHSKKLTLLFFYKSYKLFKHVITSWTLPNGEIKEKYFEITNVI